MKRPPQIAEELEEKEVDKLLFLEVLVFIFSNFTTHLVIFLWLLTFFIVTFCLQERRRRLDQTLYYTRGVDVLFRWSLGTN